MAAVLVSAPSHGALTLNADGSFTYSPTSGFSGVDSFTYQASAGGVLSNTATVALMVTPPGSGLLFADSFPEASGSDPLWTVELGSWTVSNGAIQGTSATDYYGFAYVNGDWEDYVVQAQIKFPAGGYGGGIGGQVNPATGAHYGVWIYPETTPGGPATLQVIKFEGWTTWSGTPIAQASLPSVGTTFHTLRAIFQGINIQASVDGVQYINVTDNGFDSTAPFTSGGISLDIYTQNTSYVMSVANVSVTEIPPVAQNDAYTMSQGNTLSVAAPGVLANDTGTNLTATLLTQPTNGTVTFNSDGSFTYTPSPNYSGSDSFTYQAYSGSVASNTATVTITVMASGLLFYDSFSGPTGPDPLWTTELGSWNVANGTMNGSSPLNNYGYTYVGGNWTDYSLQAQIQFPAGGFGGGIGGRLNAATGAHYGVWVYPEGSAGGSAVLKLVKFEGWTTWSGTPMAEANLPTVGTVAHTLLVNFLGSTIQVSYDGVQYINVTDNGFASTAAFTSGGITIDMYTYNASYVMSVGNISVQAPAPVAENDAYEMSEGSTLNVAAPGVLTNDTGSGLTAILVSPPMQGTLSLQSNGSFTYTPVASFSGVDSFTYQASEGGPASNTATVTIVVNPPGTLFSDSFSGPSGPDPLWTTVLGSWNVANGTTNGSSPLVVTATLTWAGAGRIILCKRRYSSRPGHMAAGLVGT